MRILLLALLSFASLPAFAAADLKPAARQVLDLFQANDVVVLGEIHGVHEQRALLSELAGENGGRRAFEAIATEALWTIDQPVIDKYLRDGDESWFYDSGWFSSLNVREAFRRLYRNHDTVCAVDIDFENPDQKPKERAAEFRQRLATFPAEVRAKMLKGTSVEKLLEDGSLIDREYLMAVAIDSCLKSHRKVLVHLGQDHVSGLDPAYLKQVAGQELDTLQWLNFLHRGLRYVSVRNMIEVPADASPAQKAMAALYQAKGAAAPFLVASKGLPANVRKLMTADGVEDWRRSEFVIVGPLGTPDKKIK